MAYIKGYDLYFKINGEKDNARYDSNFDGAVYSEDHVLMVVNELQRILRSGVIPIVAIFTPMTHPM